MEAAGSPGMFLSVHSSIFFLTCVYLFIIYLFIHPFTILFIHYVAIWQEGTSNRISRRSFSILPIDDLKSRPVCHTIVTTPTDSTLREHHQ